MARFRLCRHCGELHQLGRWPDNCRDNGWPRSDLAAPFVIRDDLGGINGLYHHAALKRFDSKRAYSQATRDHGCIEVGNERLKQTHPDVAIPDKAIGAAINDALERHGVAGEYDTESIDYAA